MFFLKIWHFLAKETETYEQAKAWLKQEQKLYGSEFIINDRLKNGTCAENTKIDIDTKTIIEGPVCGYGYAFGPDLPMSNYDSATAFKKAVLSQRSIQNEKTFSKNSYYEGECYKDWISMHHTNSIYIVWLRNAHHHKSKCG